MQAHAILRCATTLVGALLLSLGVHGQSDLELATYYYNTGAFEQARLYLDNLYKKDPSTYEMYLNTLLELEDFETAEKVVKSRLKKRKDKSMANVDLGSLYLRIGKTELAMPPSTKHWPPFPRDGGRPRGSLRPSSNWTSSTSPWPPTKRPSGKGRTTTATIMNSPTSKVFGATTRA